MAGSARALPGLTPAPAWPEGLLPLAGDVLDECERCTWWVPADEIEGGVCWWCALTSPTRRN